MFLLSKRILLKAVSIGLSSLLIFVYTLNISNTGLNAGSLTTMSDTMTRLKISEESSHDITFDLASGSTLDADEEITLDFDEDDTAGRGAFFAVDGANDAIADYAVTIDKSSSPTAMTVVGVDGDCTGHSDPNDIAVSANDTTGVITFTACSSFTSSDDAATIRIQIGTAAGGTNRITNPDAADTYTIDVTAAPVGENDTGTISVPILNDDQVVVSSTVDPAMTVSLSSTTCDLGTLSTTTIETCNYNITVTTNSTNGYKATIVEGGDLRTSGGASINDEGGDNSISSGTEEYGAATSNTDAGNDIVTYTNCNDPAADGQEASAITGTEQQFAGASGAVTEEATTLCHAAAISGDTTSGSYSHVVTLIITALF